jgi:SAM-dependent methyltransferase
MAPSPVGTASGKTRFDDIYNEPDPRAYVRRLAPLEYEIPHHAQGVFRRTRADRSAADGTDGPVTVLDLCCSYGFNAALLNHDVTLAELYAHYTSHEAEALTPAELIEHDKKFYASRRRADAAPVIGLDTADNAVQYARAVGLLDEAYAENLEHHPPSPRLRRAVAGAGLITVTGGVGYITHRTFQALLECRREPVWVSAFVLRTVPYQPVIAELAAKGLTTETDSAQTYPQRLFTSAAEQRRAVELVLRAGDDPTGLEADGRYHTRLYQSRPSSV